MINSSLKIFTLILAVSIISIRGDNIYIIGGNVQSITSTTSLALEAKLNDTLLSKLTENLENSNNQEQILWRWTSNLPSFAPLLNQRTLVLNGKDFMDDSSFIFNVNAIGSWSLFKYGSASVIVEFKRTEIIPIIVGGNRNVQKGDYFSLDASSSYNPDQMTVYHKWDCKRLEGNIYMPCDINLPSLPYVEIDSDFLDVGRYEFSVSLDVLDSKYSDNSATVWIFVEDSQSKIPMVILKPFSTENMYLNPDSKAVFVAYTFIETPVEDTWEIFSDNQKLNLEELKEKVWSNTSSSTLILKKNLLKESTNYIIKYSATSQQAIGWGEINMFVKQTPKIDCLVSPLEGYYIETTFNVKCITEETNNFDFTYMMKLDDERIYKIGKTVSSSSSFAVPIFSNNSQNVTIIIKVTNRDEGTSKTLEKKIVLEMNNRTDHKAYFKSCLQNMNLFRVLDQQDDLLWCTTMASSLYPYVDNLALDQYTSSSFRSTPPTVIPPKEEVNSPAGVIIAVIIIFVLVVVGVVVVLKFQTIRKMGPFRDITPFSNHPPVDQDNEIDLNVQVNDSLSVDLSEVEIVDNEDK